MEGARRPSMERRLLAALERGPAHRQQLARRGRVLALSGFFAAGYAGLRFLPGQDAGTLVHVAVMTAGGWLAGLSWHFIVAAAQWPVLSRFIDRRALEEAAGPA